LIKCEKYLKRWCLSVISRGEEKERKKGKMLPKRENRTGKGLERGVPAGIRAAAAVSSRSSPPNLRIPSPSHASGVQTKP